MTLSSSAANTSAAECRLRLRVDEPAGRINPNIYGHFAEHLGRCVYEGIWVGEDSPIPNTRGIRKDVVGALKYLNIPVLRWPGGCFADEYHWKDGIGPREKRPTMINTHWGGVSENNHFGTHEFMDLCQQIGASPYICGNVGSGTVQEMMQWVEYITSDAESPMTQLRRNNGRHEPWKLPYLGVGNESWGCGGNMRPEYYADNFRHYNTYVKNYPGNRVERFACGANGADFNWTEVLMSQAASHMNGLSLHFYTLPTGNWSLKGSSTVFGEEEWHSTFVQTLRIDDLITRHAEIMDKHDPSKRVGLIVDEWGTWYDVETGTNPRFLYQQNTLRDALVAAINLNIFNQHCDRVTMANIAQTVNVLQALILTDKERIRLTPTYHVFEMYKVHQGATLIPVELECPEYRLGGASLPMLNASASRDVANRTHLSIANLDPNQPARVSLAPLFASMKGRLLTANEMSAHNTFDAPSRVHPRQMEFEQGKVVSTVTIPAKSVTVLELE